MRQLKITQQITSRDNDSLEKYLLEIGKIDLLTPEEEVELAKQIAKGDEDALEKLTKANLRFVVSVAKQYQNQGLSLSDLINEGNVGLIKAGRRFDETRGFKFISYAVWWIRQSILQALVENARMVRLPLNKIGSYNRMNKVMMKFEAKFEREPSVEELAELMDVSENDIEEMKKGFSKHVSMDAPLNENEESTMSDVIISDDENGAVNVLKNESLQHEIKVLLSKMNSRDAAILSCFFGINGEPVMNLDEIGERYNLTKERVRQIKEKAIRRLRKSTSTKRLKSYLG
jgi:RNA polymerase primary sigma factor